MLKTTPFGTVYKDFCILQKLGASFFRKIFFISINIYTNFSVLRLGAGRRLLGVCSGGSAPENYQKRKNTKIVINGSLRGRFEHLWVQTGSKLHARHDEHSEIIS